MPVDMNQTPVQSAGEKTFFAPGTSFEGTLTTPGDVEIAGEFTGEIVSDGKVSLRKVGDVTISSRDLELLGATYKGDVTVTGAVIVDRESSLHGNIRSATVRCEGEIHGNLNVSENITLLESAQVVGDISAPSMEVANGARIQGRVQMGNT